MMETLGRWLVGTMLALGVVAALAWIHSSMQGIETQWARPDGSHCGRFASSRGRLLWQTCDVVSLRTPDDPFLKWPLQLPQAYTVGTNPNGDRTKIECGGFSIPFAFPAEGMFFGVTSAIYDAADNASSTRWACRWSEQTVSYWVIVLALMLGPVCELIAWSLRRIRSKGRLQARLGAV
jgi:hypothetical protein